MKNNLWASMLEKIGNLLFCQLRIVSILMLIFFIQTLLVFLTFENFSLYQVLKPNSILSILIFFLFFTVLALIISNISAIVIWMSAKIMKGQGTYSQTFEAFVWGMIYLTIPFSLFFVLLEFNLPVPFILRKIFQLGMYLSLIFGFFIMLKNISKFHVLSFVRSFFTLLMAAGILFPLTLLIMYFSKMYGDFNSSLRYLFILITPISVQLIVMLALLLPSKSIRNKASETWRS